LDSYRKLNAAKFLVLQDIERHFAHQPFAVERQYYESKGRLALAHVERWIPAGFALLYLGILGARLLA
jgi:hypothetical protein